MSLIAGANAVWVANKGSGTVSRIDADGNRTVATIHVGGQPWGLAYAFGSLWVGNYQRGIVARIDPATNRIVAKVRCGSAPIALTSDRRSVWVGDYSEPALFRIDPATSKVMERVPLPGKHLGLLRTARGIWVASEEGELALFTPDTRTVRARLQGGADTTFVAACQGSVWATNFAGTELWQVDQEPVRVVRRIPIGPGAAGIGCSGKTLWLASYRRNQLLRVDGFTVRARLRTGQGPTDVLVAFDGVWVANSGDGTVTRFPSL